MQATVEVPPVEEWRRRELDAAALERIAKRGSIRLAKREGLLARARRRLGWRR